MNTIEQVRVYNGQNSFMLSLRSNLNRWGKLSPKQLAAAEKFLAPKPAPKTEDFTYKAGDKINITKWLSRTLAKQNNMEYFFRNLVVEECHAESIKAIQVSFRFDSEVTSSCHCCGRGLDNEISKATGVGPVCAKKYLKMKRVSMDNAQEILDKIEEEARSAGVFKSIWIPKSQLRTTAQRVLFEDKRGNEKY